MLHRFDVSVCVWEREKRRLRRQKYESKRHKRLHKSQSCVHTESSDRLYSKKVKHSHTVCAVNLLLLLQKNNTE